jgi:hypothetical protein
MSGKISAIGSNCYVGSNDLSGDVGSISNLGSLLDTFDVTALNATGMERIPGRKDGAIQFAAFFNDDAGQSHLTFSAAPTTDVLASVVIGTPALDSAMASMFAKQVSYDLGIDNAARLSATINLQANGKGLEWGEMLTAGKQSFATGTVNGTAIDLGDTSTLFGAAAYLHVFSVASGTAVFKVQDSDDNSSFTDVSGLTFTGATGPTVERLQTGLADTIRQYVRITGTGTHGAAVIAVNFVRYTETGPA